MSNVPPPLPGFNNNVRHRGRVFHIQTEDSGVKSPRIVTHLFADGGRIIRTRRTDYAEHIDRSDMQPFVRSLMKEQHKGMFMELRMGELDALLEDVCGPFEQPLQISNAPPPPIVSAPPGPLRSEPAEPLLTEPAPAPDFETPPLGSAFGDSDRAAMLPMSNPNLRKLALSAAPSSAGAFELDVAALERLPHTAALPSFESTSEAPPAVRPLRTSNPPPRKLRPNVPAPGATVPPSLSRPSARFAGAPSKSSPSIFGEGVISEQSLDEVILSYLAEDLDGSE